MGLEVLRQSGLLKRFICRVPRLGAMINYEVLLGDRAKPYRMIAPPLPYKRASRAAQ